MMRLSARNVAISGVALLGLFVVFWHAQAIDAEEHSRFRDEIQQLKQWDMALNQDVLKVRSRLLPHDDSIAAAVAELEQLQPRDVSANARQTMQISQAGMQAVEKAMTGMTLVREQMTEIAKSVVQLGKKGEAIGAIIETVTDLADQSNLLAINAAMQAAKAGEQGKGFAVVAEEGKSLSDQSKQAAEQIQSILTEIRQASFLAVRVTEQGTASAEAGVQRSAEAGESIRVLSQSIGEAAEATQQIAALPREQVVGVNQVTSAIESVKKASLQSLSGTQQIETAIQDLHGVGQTLTQLIEQYALHNSVRHQIPCIFS